MYPFIDKIIDSLIDRTVRVEHDERQGIRTPDVRQGTRTPDDKEQEPRTKDKELEQRTTELVNTVTITTFGEN